MMYDFAAAKHLSHRFGPRRMILMMGLIAALLPTGAANAQTICDGPSVTCDGQCVTCDGLGGCSCDLHGSGFLADMKRIRLNAADQGITFQNNLTQFYMGNTTGGNEQRFLYSGHGDYLANVDFGKLGVQEGLFLKVRAEHRFGTSLSGITGSVLPSNVAADLPVPNHEDLYITNFMITQALSEEFVLFAGKMDALDGDANAYAHGRGIRQFSNLGFVVNPIALRTIPYSTLGAGFAFLKDGAPLLSFIVWNPTNTTRTSGFSELFSEGVVLSGELNLPTDFYGLPGHQLFGATWSSRDMISLDQDPRIILPNVPIDRQSGSWSLYWNCDQALVQDRCDPKRTWGYFARAGIADKQTNPLQYFLSAGIGGASPLKHRTNDSFGAGYFYAGTSSDVGRFLETALGPIGDGQGIELFYNAAVTPALTITPDMQVLMPAQKSLNTALVAGLRMNLAF
ncbi:Carbohydrate-selective porin, OprB family [Roseimaritima multifibrata]|uniref:Carbohydrate-selective porin, OprB family n=1 Tax=Roseimaritima multifibrata TaxID=1930274 RepID=A0A517MM03_9BACT|nr:carbohydrate porin [Roseimaritima multifibrata]QDS95889.1 Carbohydrate-selective porin, OprB family [Roseimaritima multifibrata]